MKPRILLSVNSKRDNYIEAVNNCGGIAVPQYCPDVSTEYAGVLCPSITIADKGKVVTYSAKRLDSVSTYEWRKSD